MEPVDTQFLLVFASTDAGPFWMSSNAEKDESRVDKQLRTTTDVMLKIPELIHEVNADGVADTAGGNMQQLKDLCAQHGIPTFKTVLNVLEQNRSELELELKRSGLNTKGKNKRELIELCAHYQVAITMTVAKIKEGWEGKAKGLLQVLWEGGLIGSAKLKHC